MAVDMQVQVKVEDKILILSSRTHGLIYSQRRVRFRVTAEK
jgi:hypothetical protein